jgi:PKD repeat protein
VTVFPTSNFQVSGGGLWCNTPVEIQALNISNVMWQPSTGLSNPNATQTLASPSDSTWYHASGLDANGCAVLADDSVLVIPGNAPAASFTYQQLNNYEVAFANTSTNAEQSTWIIYGSTFTTSDCLFNFPFDNTYTVELIVQNACGSDTIQTVINVIKMVGIEDVETNPLNIYPNPAKDVVCVFNPFQSKSALIQVFDAKGACVMQRNMTENSINIDLSQLQAGLYELLVSDDSKRFTARLLHQ